MIAAGSSVTSLFARNDDFAWRMGQMEDDGSSSEDGTSSSLFDQDDSSSSSSTASTTPSHHDAASVLQRRKFLHNFVASTAAMASASAIDASSSSDSSTPNKKQLHPPEAAAFDYTYPIELTSPPTDTNGQLRETSSNSLSKLQQERLVNQRSKVLATQNELSQDPLGLSSFSSTYDGLLLVTGVSLWTLALWFLSGSRSNPLVNPVANLLYDAESEQNQWLRERNSGYFSEYPPQLSIVLGMIFVLLGIIADRSVYFLSDGEASIPVELGGVTAISGAFWEVGRLAAGEKSSTKVESERDTLLLSEFEEFANKRLILRSNASVHRSEVVKAFRRYNPKYRVMNEEYPLSDVEMERIVKGWARRRGLEMSSAGFLGGVGIDSDADAFAPR